MSTNGNGVNGGGVGLRRDSGNNGNNTNGVVGGGRRERERAPRPSMMIKGHQHYHSHRESSPPSPSPGSPMSLSMSLSSIGSSGGNTPQSISPPLEHHHNHHNGPIVRSFSGVASTSSTPPLSSSPLASSPVMTPRSIDRTMSGDHIQLPVSHHHHSSLLSHPNQTGGSGSSSARGSPSIEQQLHAQREHRGSGNSGSNGNGAGSSNGMMVSNGSNERSPDLGPEPFVSTDDSERECIQWARSGVCPRGSGCPFVHKPRALRPCKFFLRGYCVDPKCEFSHHPKWLSLPASPFDCGLCAKYFTGDKQREQHLIGREHKHSLAIRDLNRAVERREHARRAAAANGAPEATASYCYNCGRSGHAFNECMVGFCRYHANRECQKGNKCELQHVT
jgi:hypothetical protein